MLEEGRPRRSGLTALESEQTVPLLRAFSCPMEPFNQSFLAFVVQERARAATRLLLERDAAQLANRAPGLSDVLDRWLVEDTSFATAFGPAWGELYRIVGADSGSVLDGAAALGLWLGASKVPGQWSIALERPIPLRWGRWLLPEADWLAVESDGCSARIGTRSKHGYAAYRFDLRDGEWEGEGGHLLPHFGTRREKIALLPSTALASETLDFLRPMAVPAITSEIRDGFQETLARLHQNAPAYLPWVMRILREVIVLHPEPTVIRSGSSSDQPGMIHVSYTSNWASLGESLVHEASHQYLDVLTWLGPVDDGTDTNLYYSPIKKQARSLYRITLTYHAFANVLLFYRLCLANGAPDEGYCARSERDLLPKLEQLETPLRDNPALTFIGRALYEPLMRRVH
jgi:HEXXH motif-containing protein